MSYVAPDWGDLDFSALSGPYTAPDWSDLDLSAHPEPYTAPYTAPDWGDLDFSALSGPYTAPDWSALNFSSSGSSGTLSANLGFSASLNGVVTIGGPLSASLGFNAAFAGEVNDVSGSLSVSLDFRPQFDGFQDWLSAIPPVQLQEVYRLVITGAADGLADLYVGGISSWQATYQAGGRSSYVQAVIPAAEALLPDIQARQNGELVIQKGYKLSTGEVRYEEILRSRFDTLRPDRGQRALTVTVSGYLPSIAVFSGSRTLTGIRTISVQGAKRRVRCNIDLFLKPGMTATAMGETFQVGYINYYVSQTDKFCEVGER